MCRLPFLYLRLSTVRMIKSIVRSKSSQISLLYILNQSVTITRLVRAYSYAYSSYCRQKRSKKLSDLNVLQKGVKSDVAWKTVVRLIHREHTATRMLTFGREVHNTVELQWLDHLWNHEKMFETGGVRTNECESWHWVRRQNKDIVSIFYNMKVCCVFSL